ncbi:hypothetical protein HUK80_17635 [Flavobacterium sp. MAH-1]|uniref:Tissue inhibitor of metalloproteinase n=1 Tax=Flavobacterium agri TaxID=2743471 RepID=A0A7Y9C8S8_9FLAO|nr:hypothetical protein [Flavobacterium agri]NUY82729.1 hypothetical protein [Flavobacterium agri]NYA72752.1 hypothetical protein [Flavobacterium agri]
MKRLFSILFLLLICQKSLACECEVKQSVKVNWNASNTIFVGKVIQRSSEVKSDGSLIFIYEFQINTIYKSASRNKKLSEKMYFHIKNNCGYVFEVDREYLIYANQSGNSNSFECSICSRTDILKNIKKEELSYLKKLKK